MFVMTDRIYIVSNFIKLVKLDKVILYVFLTSKINTVIQVNMM